MKDEENSKAKIKPEKKKNTRVSRENEDTRRARGLETQTAKEAQKTFCLE